jgi:hypothetical protein
MSRVIAISGSGRLYLPEYGKHKIRSLQGHSTAEIRRLLSDLSLRPHSHGTVLRRLLRRALAAGPAKELPVTNHAVPDPVGPS